MKKLLIFLFSLLTLAGFSQTTPFTFTQISTSAVDLNRPFAGPNMWYGHNLINAPNPGFQTNRLDYYWRFESNDIMPFNNAQGVYNFNRFDAEIQTAIDNGQKFAFGIMNTCCSGGTAGGATANFPLWLYNAMNSGGQPTFVSGGAVIPNYNSIWINARKAMHQAVNQHIMTGSYKGIAYKDIIDYVDILEYGDYGECATLHGTNPSAAILDSLFNTVIFSYTNFQVQGQPAMLDGGTISGFLPTPKDVGYYILTVANAHGKLGISDLCLGCTDFYRDGWMTGNTNVFSGLNFGTAVSNMYKYAPLTGEPPNFAGLNLSALPGQSTTRHLGLIGDGNFGGMEGDATTQNNYRQAVKNAGYRLTLATSGGSMTTTPVSGGAMQVTMPWINQGGAPTYENWNITYQLVQGSTLKWTGVSAFNPYLFSPGSTNTAVDNFTLTNVPAGTGYTLTMSVKDPKGYRFPMPLFITTPQNADGSYTLRTNITVGTSVTTANLVVIFGESNASGEAQNNSGPTPTELSARTNTQIWNDITGTYQSLQVTANGSGSNNQIRQGVNPPNVHGFEIGLANGVDAGNLTIPTYLVKLGSPGAKVENWTNPSVPQPNQGGLVPSNSVGWSSCLVPRMNAAIAYLNSHGIPFKITVWVSIGINDFNQGTTTSTYQTQMNQFRSDFRGLYGSTIKFIYTKFTQNYPYNATIDNIASTDPQGNSVAINDDTEPRQPDGAHWTYAGYKSIAGKCITAMPATGTTPIANAGTDQSITLPASSVTLDGSNSAGSPVSYTWSLVSGPSSPLIVSPNSVTTSVTGLIAGTYQFKLTVNGGNFDLINVIVNTALPPAPSIFTTQVPKNVTDNDNLGTVGTEKGVRFTSSVSGYITGIRFYKTAGNVGTHIGELYSNTGTRLAQATFVNETTTGWQTVSITPAVAITANTSYVAAYFSSLGNYVEDNDYFKVNGVTNTNLTAVVDATGGASGADPGTGQGPYIDTNTPAFPNTLFKSANYWVDVVFSPNPTGTQPLHKVHTYIFQAAP